MKVTPLSDTIGATVTGVDLAVDAGDLAVELVSALQFALLDHHVIVIPAQHLNDDQHRRLAETWGTPHPHPVAGMLGSTEVLASVENSAEKPPQKASPDGGWHTDYTFHTHIADAAMLRAEVCPPHGGATGWASTHAAFDSLPDDVKTRIVGLSAHHDLGPKFEFEMRRTYGDDTADQIVESFAGVDHPVVAEHPVTGRPLLFVNPGYTRHIVGVSDAESNELLTLLFAALANPAHACTHDWAPGDLAIWDEHATVHRGPTDFAPHHRLLRRCTVGERSPLPVRSSGQ